MRKILICLCCLVVLLGCSIPAFAISNSDGDTVYAPLTFSTLEVNNSGIQSAWPFNSSQKGTHQAIVDQDGLAAEGSMTSDTEFFAKFWISYGSSFTLSAPEEQFLKLDTLDSYRIYSTSLLPPAVDVSFTLWTFEAFEGAGNYLLTPIYVSGSIPFQQDDGSFFLPIGYGLRYLIDPEFKFEYAMISDLEITFSTIEVTQQASEYSITFDALGYQPSFADDWIRQQELSSKIYTSGSVDFTDWVVGAVGAFLDFSFFPGITVNHLFGFVFVFIVVFMIIKFFK